MTLIIERINNSETIAHINERKVDDVMRGDGLLTVPITAAMVGKHAATESTECHTSIVDTL